jgi:hypothetical protein
LSRRGVRIQAEDLLVGKLRVEEVDGIDLGPNPPGRPCRGVRDRVDDELASAIAIGCLNLSHAALGVDDDIDSRIINPRRSDLLDREAGMDRAVALLEN